MHTPTGLCLLAISTMVRYRRIVGRRSPSPMIDGGERQGNGAESKGTKRRLHVDFVGRTKPEIFSASGYQTLFLADRGGDDYWFEKLEKIGR